LGLLAFSLDVLHNSKFTKFNERKSPFFSESMNVVTDRLQEGHPNQTGLSWCLVSKISAEILWKFLCLGTHEAKECNRRNSWVKEKTGIQPVFF
jgi:hypothetical protein